MANTIGKSDASSLVAQLEGLFPQGRPWAFDDKYAANSPAIFLGLGKKPLGPKEVVARLQSGKAVELVETRQGSATGDRRWPTPRRTSVTSLNSTQDLADWLTIETGKRGTSDVQKLGAVLQQAENIDYHAVRILARDYQDLSPLQAARLLLDNPRRSREGLAENALILEYCENGYFTAVDRMVRSAHDVYEFLDAVDKRRHPRAYGGI